MSSIRIRGNHAILTVLGVFLALGFSVSTAKAACSEEKTSNPFVAWGDTAPYQLVEGGTFEDGASGWTLSGNAHIVTDHSPWAWLGQNNQSLQLGHGSSATTPPICVSMSFPTSRMFAFTPARNPKVGSSLRVEVLYTDATRGGAAVKALGTLPDEVSWDATRKFSLAQGQLNIKPDSNRNTYIRYRFTPLYNTTWRIDDVFVDPKRR